MNNPTRSRASLLIVLLLVLAACSPTPEPPAVAQAQAESWIDDPLTGSQLPFAQLDVVSHHYSPAGVAQVELSVDGAVLRIDPSPDTASLLVNITQPWQPAGPGTYTLSVRAQSGDGTWSSPTSVTVAIGDFSTATPLATLTPTETPTPEFTATPTLTPTPEPTATFTASATALRPTFTFTPSITPTFTATATSNAPFVTFTADSTSINAGQCTTLHWTSGNIQAIYLNQQPVTGNENRQVCPTSTTTYQLLANTASGNISKELVIQVNGVVGGPGGGSTGPNIGSYTTSTTDFDVTGDCGNVSEVTINVAVSNASSVTIIYRIAGEAGTHQSSMSNVTGNIWSKTLHGSGELPAGITGELQFSFTANNAAGQANSATFGGVQYHNCKP